MPSAEPSLPRLRQAVVAARDLEPVTSELRERLGLGEPYQDPAVEYLGLRNAVFVLGDTFLEVVSPVRSDAVADPAAVGKLWREVAGPLLQLSLMDDDDDRWLVEISLTGPEPAQERFELAGVRFVFDEEAR